MLTSHAMQLPPGLPRLQSNRCPAIGSLNAAELEAARGWISLQFARRGPFWMMDQGLDRRAQGTAYSSTREVQKHIKARLRGQKTSNRQLIDKKGRV